MEVVLTQTVVFLNHSKLLLCYVNSEADDPYTE